MITKDFVEQLRDDGYHRPMEIHRRLQSHHEADIDIMPTYEQVRDFVKNVRKRAGDTDELPAIEEFVAANRYHDGIPRNQLFTFGEKLVDGKTEGSPFQLGVTSLTHLSVLEEADYFHLDATYKVSSPLAIDHSH